MSKSSKPTFFWASYADLMTSLFFIVLVLFVLTTVLLQRNVKEAEKKTADVEAKLKKIAEIETSVSKIDTAYFAYNDQHKKHILKINVEFQTGSANINNIPYSTQQGLIKAGQAIRDLIIDVNKNIDARYLLVIEGQASKDHYPLNDELSYQRALALKNFWDKNGISFEEKICEVLVSGSGQSGAFRSLPDNATNKANQRFLIHIIPKPGMIKFTK